MKGMIKGAGINYVDGRRRAYRTSGGLESASNKSNDRFPRCGKMIGSIFKDALKLYSRDSGKEGLATVLLQTGAAAIMNCRA